MTRSSHDVPLASLFFADANSASHALAAGARRVAPRSAARWAHMQWQQLEAAIGEQLAAGCPGTLGDVLVQCWRDLLALREATDPACTPRGTLRTVTLGTHDLEWATQPKLVVAIDGTTVFDVQLKLAFTLEIGVATLTVLDGRIHEIELARCSGEASVACASVTVIRHPLGELQLPWRIPFERGVPVSHASATAGGRR